MVSQQDQESEEFQIKENRSPILIALFKDGFAQGWKMAVRDCFRSSLDIKRTPKVFEKTSKQIWTQGTLFNFNEGAIIYDSQLAYQNIWKDSIKHIKLGVQIIKSKPVEIRKKTRNSGEVTFQVLRINDDKSELIRCGNIRTTQDEFVSFLQTGFVRPLVPGKSGDRNLSKDLLDLFEV